MRKLAFWRLALVLSLALPLLVLAPIAAAAEPDYDIPTGHFYTQGTGLDSAGFTITNDSGIPFWDKYQELGGAEVLGYPVSKRFMQDGYVTQAMQYCVFQWRPESGEIWTDPDNGLAPDTISSLWPWFAGTPEPAPSASGPYRAKSPEYGMNTFIWGFPSTTQRDVSKLLDAGFGWQKVLFQWNWIEHNGKGQFDWTEADRVVAASNSMGVKLIARLDFQPPWARADKAANGPSDNYQDYADFVGALVDRYKTGSQYGQIHAIEIWNEPNLSREWGNKKPDAGQYVQLLKLAYQAAKAADPNVTVISAGLTPTGTWDNNSTPDDIFLQQMYDAGAKDYFDVLGAHGAGYKAPPSMSPDQVAASKEYGGHRIFCFRRVEDLRAVMVKNGDSDKQVWLLEFGWTSDSIHPAYAWHKVTEEQKAQYIVDAYKWAAANWSPWIGVMTLWNLPGSDWTQDREEYWWSISNADGSDRPAYTALKSARQSGDLP